MRRLPLAAVALLAFQAGCVELPATAPTGSVGVSATATPALAPLASPTPSLAPTPTATPTPTPTPAAVEYAGQYLAYEPINYDVGRYSNQIGYLPRYKNVSTRTIAGIKFDATFTDAFGATLYTFSGQIDQVLAPGETSNTNREYVWADNPYISGEPFDRLASAVQGGSCKVTATVTAVAFQ